MKNFIILLFFLLFGLSFCINAQTISEEEATEYAQQWFHFTAGAFNC